jgi:hypothetical protein
MDFHARDSSTEQWFALSHICQTDEMYEEYLKYPHTWRDVLQQENTSPKFELHVELAKALLDLSVSLPRTGYADVALGGDHCGYRSCFGGGNGVASRGLTTSMAYGLIQCPIFRKDPWHFCTNQVTQQCLWMSLKHISTDVEHLDIHRGITTWAYRIGGRYALVSTHTQSYSVSLSRDFIGAGEVSAQGLCIFMIFYGCLWDAVSIHAILIYSIRTHATCYIPYHRIRIGGIGWFQIAPGISSPSWSRVPPGETVERLQRLRKMLRWIPNLDAWHK